ncbi:hypothetical protein VFPFJ_03883 [Purpureocillium lilacinum]|uniref:Uncharacterized protein n=1 Tax=Purpureocillium lilacinum TaxID=33203 RepID=A0A179GVW1_PURLI|nr:hypothetical protein VFPFJ_03883 [Purpureocillium lilacinum]OAQ82096.1 hypothetical protein VFPBJ_04680 [Purpureocillium lilacinum]OAQ92143.1 hypothetical protein VFPFJ_03883 [Purpureocillium lilacinum]
MTPWSSSTSSVIAHALWGSTKHQTCASCCCRPPSQPGDGLKNQMGANGNRPAGVCVCMPQHER